MARTWVTIGWCVSALLPLLARGDQRPGRSSSRLFTVPRTWIGGAELFDTCAACHGASGSGTRDGAIPRIAGQQEQHWQPIRPTEALPVMEASTADQNVMLRLRRQLAMLVS
jgi:cytochrome c553